MKQIRIDKLGLLLIILIIAIVTMATKWSDYGDMGDGVIADGDTFLVRDISDTSLGGTGTQKEYSYEDMKADLSAFDEIEMPNAAAPAFDQTGEFGLDTSDYQFIIRGNAADMVFTNKHRECFTLEDATAADDNVPIFSHEDGITVTKMRCWTEGGTNVVMYLSDGTNDLDSMTCIATGTDDDGNIAQATFTANEQMEFDITSVDGAVDWVNFCFTYVIIRE